MASGPAGVRAARGAVLLDKSLRKPVLRTPAGPTHMGMSRAQVCFQIPGLRVQLLGPVVNDNTLK